MNVSATDGQQRALAPLELELQAVWGHQIWEPNPDPLEVQQELLTHENLSSFVFLQVTRWNLH